VSTSTTNTTSQGQNTAGGAPGESTAGKWFSLSTRCSGAGTDYPTERGGGGSSHGGSYVGRNNNMRKQGLCFLHNQINSSNKFT
jgi:hypothetical protein